MLQAAEAAAADDDALLVPIIEMRTRNLMWGLSKPAEALEHNRAARDRLSGHPSRSELTLNEAMLLTYSGRPLDILSVLESGGPAPGSRERSLRAHAELPALVAIGQCATAAEEALPRVRRAARPPRPDRHPDSGGPPHHPDLRAGRVRPACRGLGPRRRGVRGHAADGPARRVHVARAAAGTLCAAERSGRDGPPVARRGRPRDASTAGSTGLVASCCPCSRRRLRVPATKPPRPRPRGEAAPAPTLRLCPGRAGAGPGVGSRRPGDLPGARAAFHDAAEPLAAARATAGAEAWLLHDVARLGDPASVAGRLERAGRHVRRASSSPPTPMHAAGGRRSRRTEALVDAADRFEAIGALLLAAEAATEAAQALPARRRSPRLRGDERASLDAGRVRAKAHGRRPSPSP